MTDDLGTQYIPREQLPGPKKKGWLVRLALNVLKMVKPKGPR